MSVLSSHLILMLREFSLRKNRELSPISLLGFGGLVVDKGSSSPFGMEGYRAHPSLALVGDLAIETKESSIGFTWITLHWRYRIVIAKEGPKTFVVGFAWEGTKLLKYILVYFLWENCMWWLWLWWRCRWKIENKKEVPWLAPWLYASRR
ncbi:hypothetical protein V6N13_051263 [Hibiscus sabdariffa]|uniref:Uncharacterized protein n=1 Tax=Hibiscus sabdariffa TaxID=183260 RepID=A0ABR2T340_9ROSI